MDISLGIMTAATAFALVLAGVAFFFLLRGEFQRFLIGAGAVVLACMAVVLFWLPQSTPISGVRFALAGFATLTWLLVAVYLEMRRAINGLSQSDAIIAELAGTDELTGLYTRQSLADQARAALSSAKNGDDQVSMMVVDVDQFRNVNESAGTEAGDDVLRSVAAVVGNQAQADDCAARIGSDQFALLLPNSALTTALQTAELIRSEVARTRVESLDVDGSFTVSIGVAGMPVGIRDAEALLVSADAAMLEAKRKGRNQVCASPDTFEPTESEELTDALPA